MKQKKNRFLHEKREALDAIELLKLFAKHKGISIEIAADADTPNQFQTTITTDDNSCDGSATNSDRDGNSITITSNQMSASKTTTKATNRVIQMQPSSPTIKIQQANPLGSDELHIEQATPIDLMKNSADI